MNNELYELIDTTIKIGLGASIAGLSAYFLAHKSFKHEMAMKSFDDKNNLVKDLAFKLESIESYVDDSGHSFFNGNFEEAKASTLSALCDAYSAGAIANLIGSDELLLSIKTISGITETMYHVYDQDNPSLSQLQGLADQLVEAKKSAYPHLRTAYGDHA